MEDSEYWKAVKCTEVRQSFTNVACFFGIHHSIISWLWKQFQTSQTVVWRPVDNHPRVTTPAEDRYIAVVTKQNQRSTSTHMISMVAENIGKRISATTVCQMLYLNGLKSQVQWVWILLPVRSREAQLKWCHQYANWTVSDWCNIMFTDESRFVLQPYDNCVRVWREQVTCNLSKSIMHSALET